MITTIVLHNNSNSSSVAVFIYHMLSGALLTVRLMVMRPPPKLPTFLTSSFCGFKAVFPANADCWIAEVAMLFDESCLLCFWSRCGMVGERGAYFQLARMKRCYIWNCKDLWIRKSTHQQAAASHWFMACIWISILILSQIVEIDRSYRSAMWL